MKKEEFFIDFNQNREVLPIEKNHFYSIFNLYFFPALKFLFETKTEQSILIFVQEDYR